jgi:hypothetical protein
VTSALLTPFTAGEAVELGNRVWRKKLLPVGDVEYKGRTLHFTRDYLGRLVTAFQSRAYDQVPFQLADHANTHTNDPERTRGEITSMELGDDGLYITAQVTPDGEKVLEANPKLGVSARIVEDYARSDGQFFKTAVQHVLGTLDPRIPGLGAWEAIEAASPVPDLVDDMSAGTYTALTADAPQDKAARKAAKAQRKAAKQTGPASDGKQTEPASDPAGADPEGGAVMANLNAEQQRKLDRLLAIPDETLAAIEAGGTVVTPAELEALTSPDEAAEGDDDAAAEALATQIAAMSDAEIAALEAEFNAENETGAEAPEPEHAPEGEPVGASLANDEYEMAILMARAETEETKRELAVITARLREEDYQGEKRRLADLGVPPYITELAKPLLEGAGHAVELANGKTVDAGAVMRQVLTEFARQVKLLDLGAELGSPMDEPEDAGREEAAESRAAYVAGFKSMTGLK